jgi:hypothetical protein
MNIISIFCMCLVKFKIGWLLEMWHVHLFGDGQKSRQDIFFR